MRTERLVVTRLLGLLALAGALACSSVPPMAPTVAMSRMTGSRVLAVRYKGAVVPGYRLFIVDDRFGVEALTDAHGETRISGFCDQPARITSPEYRPGWMPLLSVEPCGVPVVIDLRQIGVGVLS